MTAEKSEKSFDRSAYLQRNSSGIGLLEQVTNAFGIEALKKDMISQVVQHLAAQLGFPFHRRTVSNDLATSLHASGAVDALLLGVADCSWSFSCDDAAHEFGRPDYHRYLRSPKTLQIDPHTSPPLRKLAETIRAKGKVSVGDAVYGEHICISELIPTQKLRGVAEEELRTSLTTSVDLTEDEMNKVRTCTFLQVQLFDETHATSLRKTIAALLTNPVGARYVPSFMFSPSSLSARELLLLPPATAIAALNGSTAASENESVISVTVRRDDLDYAATIFSSSTATSNFFKLTKDSIDFFLNLIELYGEDDQFIEYWTFRRQTSPHFRLGVKREICWERSGKDPIRRSPVRQAGVTFSASDIEKDMPLLSDDLASPATVAKQLRLLVQADLLHFHRRHEKKKGTRANLPSLYFFGDVGEDLMADPLRYADMLTGLSKQFQQYCDFMFARNIRHASVIDSRTTNKIAD